MGVGNERTGAASRQMMILSVWDWMVGEGGRGGSENCERLGLSVTCESRKMVAL